MTEENQAPHPSHIVRRITVSGGRGGQQAFVLDIFPHRLRPAEGYTREDMVLTLLAMLDGMDRRSFHGTHDLNHITQEDFVHPHGVYGRGSVLCTPGCDENAQQVVVKEGFSIELWDGRSFDLGAFAPTRHAPIEARNLQQNTRSLLTNMRGDPVIALVVGMVEEILPIAYDRDIHTGPLEICLHVAARAARLVQTRQGVAGTAGARGCLDDAARFLREIDSLWICPPDRGWCPEMRLKGAAWDEVRVNVDASLMKAGRRIAAALKAEGPGMLTNQAAINGDDPDLSNHQRIQIKRQLRTIDEMIENEVPEGFLKPAAAKRRAKRATAA